jgi:hypothetical protein
MSIAPSIFVPAAGAAIELETGIKADGTALVKTKTDLAAAPAIQAFSFATVTADAKDKAKFFDHVGELYSFRTQEIQEELADLARVDYPNYVKIKRAFRENIGLEVKKMLFESVQRFRQVGYTDEQALEMSKPAADALYKQLKHRFDTLFPHGGKVTKTITEHL